MDSLDVPAGLCPTPAAPERVKPWHCCPFLHGPQALIHGVFRRFLNFYSTEGLLLFIDLSIIFFKALLGNWEYKGEAVQCFQLP